MAHKALPDEDRLALSGLMGLHSYACYHEILAGEKIYTQSETAQKRILYPPVEHPIIMSHPITERPVPYISPLTLQQVLGAEKGVSHQKTYLQAW